MTRFDWLLAVPAAALMVFMVAPLGSLLWETSPTAIWAEARRADNWRVIADSIACGAVAASIAAVTGIPLAYLLVRRDFPAKRLVEGIIQLPVALPHILIGLALLSLLGPAGTLGPVFEPLDIAWVNTRLGVIAAMTYVSIPYVVNQARAGFAAVPERLEKTARSLGASPAAVFFEITLPLARRPVLDGLSLTWGRSISELGAIMILAYHPMTVAVYIWHVYSGADGHRRVRALGALALVVYLAVFIGFRLWSGAKRGVSHATPR